MYRILITILVAILLTNCSTAKLERQWQQAETVNFQANKVLIIGISANIGARRNFETQMAKAFEKKGVVAVRSIDFFGASFTEEKKTEVELDIIENSLIKEGFDAVLFSKVIGKEKKITVLQAYKNLENKFQSFGDYYYSNQHIYAKEESLEYTIYNTETTVYCLCPGKPKELLWVGQITLTEIQNQDKSIRDYVKRVITELTKNKLIIVQ